MRSPPDPLIFLGFAPQWALNSPGVFRNYVHDALLPETFGWGPHQSREPLFAIGRVDRWSRWSIVSYFGAGKVNPVFSMEGGIWTGRTSSRFEISESWHRRSVWDILCRWKRHALGPGLFVFHAKEDCQFGIVFLQTLTFLLLTILRNVKDLPANIREKQSSTEKRLLQTQLRCWLVGANACNLFFSCFVPVGWTSTPSKGGLRETYWRRFSWSNDPQYQI